MGKRQFARGNVQHGQIPMYIGTHAPPNGMRPSVGREGRDGRKEWSIRCRNCHRTRYFSAEPRVATAWV